MNNKKSSCIDAIPDCIIKACYQRIIPPLCYITNVSLSTGNFLERLIISKVKPLHKKDFEIEIVNYIPVSLLSVFLKILERIMHNRLISYASKYNITYNQHVFFKGKSSSKMIIILRTKK